MKLLKFLFFSMLVMAGIQTTRTTENNDPNENINIKKIKEEMQRKAEEHHALLERMDREHQASQKKVRQEQEELMKKMDAGSPSAYSPDAVPSSPYEYPEDWLKKYQAESKARSKKMEEDLRKLQEDMNKGFEDMRKQNEQNFYNDASGSYFSLLSSSQKPKYLKVLGLGEEATWEDVKKTHKQLALKLHPDRPGGDKEKFTAMSEAYEKLDEIYNPQGSSGSPAPQEKRRDPQQEEMKQKLNLLGLEEGATWEDIEKAFESTTKDMDKSKMGYIGKKRAYEKLREIYNPQGSSSSPAASPYLTPHLSAEARKKNLDLLGLKDNATWEDIEEAFAKTTKDMDKGKMGYKIQKKAYDALKGEGQ